MDNFSAFSPMAGGTLDTYYRDNEYPYDLDASLDYVRVTDTFSVWPHPDTIGHVEGLVPMFDSLEYSLMKGKTPYGGLMGNNTPVNVVFPDLSGGMIKKGT
ncbi:MAG: hypothetical protein ACYDAO_09395 [Thermoplasmataceae archaeon]